MTRQNSTTEEETLLDLENDLQQEIDEVVEAEEAIEADLERGEISGAEEELEKLKGALSRAQADYANLLKRVDRDRADMTTFITANVVKKILPAVDNLERALVSVPEDIASHVWTDGIRATLQSLLRQLETLGVQPFVSIDQTVDTERHEVMSQMPGECGIIISEFEKGYTLHDRVIRHAKVIVGSGEE